MVVQSQYTRYINNRYVTSQLNKGHLLQDVVGAVLTEGDCDISERAHTFPIEVWRWFSLMLLCIPPDRSCCTCDECTLSCAQIVLNQHLLFVAQ